MPSVVRIHLFPQSETDWSCVCRLRRKDAPIRFIFAEVAQLIEHQPSKLRVASLSLVFRSKMTCNALYGHRSKAETAEADCPFICEWSLKNRIRYFYKN